MTRRFLIVIVALGLYACASADESPADYYKSMAEEAEPSAVASGTAMPGAIAPPPPSPSRARRESKKKGGRGGGSLGAELDAEGGLSDDTVAEAPEAPKKKRMVHYNGYLRLKVNNPTETLQQASEMVDNVKGYVESLTATQVILRVPVVHFRSIFNEITELGDVMARSMSATDVTDAYTATELRAKILTASRDRLITLLGQARNARQKLRLLREIRRLQEQIDQLEMQLTALSSLADFSRLTIDTEPHQVHVRSPDSEPIAAFRWIHRLSPFNRDIAARGDELELRVPKGLVLLEDHDYFIAESADGAKFWASTRKNAPEGSTDFWIGAVEARLAGEYGEAKISTVGDYKILKLVDQSEKAYRYLIGVHAVGDDLHVIEIYYPGEEQEKRYAPAIEAVVKGGAA